MFIGMRKAKGTEETIVVGDGENSGMEEEFVVCEHIEEIEEEQSPLQAKAPPQKSRAVIRVESSETQDYVSEPQGLEERETKKR